MEFIDILLAGSFWAATIRIATPLILGTLGELICERAGVLNLGIEGIMTLGAVIGWVTVFVGGDLWTGVIAAALAGALAGIVHGGFTVVLGLSQHVSGIGLTLLTTSLSYYCYRLLLPDVATPPTIEAFAPYAVPYLSQLPGLGPALFNQTPMTYLAFAIALSLGYVLYRTPLGLAVRMVGENPAACESQGLSVVALRMGAVAVGSAVMALGGAFLTMSAFNAFFFDMVNGRGWICIALVVFASWRPGKAVLGAVIFAAIDAYQLRLQQILPDVPYQVFLMMPYVASILALIVMARRADYPKALMVTYRKGER